MSTDTHRSCKRCIFYSTVTGYCLKLGKRVADPDDPPCLKKGIGLSIVRNISRRLTKREGEHERLEQTVAPVQKHVSGGGSRSVMGLQLELEPGGESDLEYVPTGIPELDEALGGGFIRGKTYLVAGETGSGKTIFSIQYLLYGAMNGEPGVYIAIDEPTEQLTRGLKRFGWDVTELVREGKLLFLDMRTHFSKVYLHDERRRIEPRFVIESILRNVKKIKAKRLVIDPIAPLIYGGTPSDILYAREFLREMVFAIERQGNITTIMTSEIPTGSRQLSRFGVEEFLATGIIVLSLEEINGRVERILYIRKARWAPVRPAKYIFEIETGKGIVIKGPLTGL